MSPNLKHLADADHYVYVIWADDEPLYVGMTCNWQSRTVQHRWYFIHHGATHIDVWHVGPGRVAAEVIESETIRALDPKWNVQQSPRREASDAAWAEYSAWRLAYDRATWSGADEWAADQEIADRVCAAAGVNAPDVELDLAIRRERLQRAVNSLPWIGGAA